MRIRETMRNLFSLGDCSLKNLLWNVFWMMNSLTINVDSHSDHRASIFLYAFDFTCLICYLYCYLLCMFYNWIWIYPVKKNHTDIIIIISLSCASCISTIKLAYMFKKRTKLTEIIASYQSIDRTIDPVSRYSRSILLRLKVVKKRSLAFWISFVCGSIVYIFMPLVAPGKNLPENSLQLYGLEPMFVSPNYEIAYFLNVLAGMTATLVPANVTVLLIVLVGYIEAHINALTEEYNSLWQDAVEKEQCRHTLHIYRRHELNKDEELNAFVKERLNFLVSRHGECVTLLRKICTCFEEVIAFEFAFTMIALCAVLLGGLEDTFLQIPYTIIQLVVDSLVGQRLLDAALLFERSIYECGWENFNASNMKTIQVVLQCSQKPLSLKAGGVTTLCFESFMSITKSVYSAYATLSNAIQ